MGRGEIGGKADTRNLASFGGSNADPDLCRLDVGDGIELLTDTRSVRSGAPLTSTLTEHDRKSFSEAVADIHSRIGDENLSRVIVATARGQVNELQRFFRVKTVKQKWDKSSGIEISFDFENYFVVRAQADEASVDPGMAQKVSV
jgi:hypothetical protein